MALDTSVKSHREAMSIPDQVRDDGSGIRNLLKLLDSVKASLRALDAFFGK